jgi:uncharacterized lipoprotein
MKAIYTLVAAAACVAFTAGCSETTKQETREAVDEAGDAVSSAAADAKENVKQAADAVEEGARNLKDKLDGDDEAAPAAEPATADPAAQ